MENTLYDTLKTKFTGVKPKPPSNKVKEQKAGEKLKAAVKSKLYTDEYKDFMDKRKAGNKI